MDRSSNLSGVGDIGPMEIVLLLLLALLLFGAKRLPDIGRGLGTGLREFKDSVSGITKPDETPAVSKAPEDISTT